MLAVDLSSYFCGARPGDLVGSHDPTLVAVSVAIAALGSYTALDLASRMQAAEGRLRRLWLALSASAMGGSIWSMHFVAMLAFGLPVPIGYNVNLTILSLIAAILVTAAGLAIVGRAPKRARNVVGAGVFMGVGVATMHYTGMEAMQMDVALSYDPILYALSVGIAVAASTAALWLVFNLKHHWPKVAASVVMAAAIAGMHYTGMAAAHYTPLPGPGVTGSVSSAPVLAAVIAIGTVGVLLMGLVSSSADRRMAAQTNAEAARFRAILDTAMDAFVSFDAEGRVTFWSAQAEAMFGWSRDELLGREHFDIVVPARHRAERRDAFKRFCETGAGLIANQRHELVVLCRDGRECPVELTSSAMWVDGKPTVNVFARDISRRKKHEDELVKARDQAEAASRAKSAFLATMSHELRTPLNAILGFSEMIRDKRLGPNGASAIPDYAAHIHSSGCHLLDLVNDILDLSKADAGQLSLDEDDCDISRVIATCANTVNTAMQAGGVSLAVEPDGGLPRLFADERRVRQILTNLLSNAAKFTPAGGRVVVHAGLTPHGELAIAVADSGIGMNAQEVATALAPFGQVDNRLSRKFEGTGLGLPITQRLLELHQGRLEITTAAARGTTVIAYFPATRLRPQPPACAA